ncbi:MAG: hypothetical protein H6Q29_721 [Bacteroidetes bacterium]|nr:hypothetical protein [Bacteroidota bacterium]
MDTLLLTVQILALLSLSALCIALIVLVVRLKEFVNVLERDVHEVSGRAIPVLDNMEAITTRVKGMTEHMEDQVQAITESFSSVKAIADNIVDLERRVQMRIEGPLLESLGTVAAVVKGLRTFVQRIRA